MARCDLTFRIFVSSTFSDPKEERVVPKLPKLFRQDGYRFQAIDGHVVVFAEQQRSR